jgi:hypothetical protein
LLSAREQLREEIEWVLRRRGLLAAEIRHEEAAARILDDCFDKQRAFILHPARRKVAITGRRAGKTAADQRLLLYTAALYPRARVGYGAENRQTAKDLVWVELTALADRHFPGAKTNETELKITLPNGSDIKLFGAANQKEAGKARGRPYRLVVLDEVEEFNPPTLRYLLREVLAPSLADHRGSLVITGTPDASCQGYLYDIDRGVEAKQWEHFHWTLVDNERFPQWAGLADWKERASRFIETELRELGFDDINDPGVRREYFGEWIRSVDAFILHIDEEKNTYSGEAPADLQYVLGIDLGFRDESAFVLTGFSRARGLAYHVTDVSHPGLPMGEIIAIARGFIDRYQPIRTVIDPATGGMSLVEELRRRYGVSVQCAEKENKAAYFRLWNADIRTCRYFFRAGSRLLAQARAGQWNDKFTREQEGIPFDLVDSALYSWREAYHHLPPRPVPAAPPDDDELEDRELFGQRRGVRPRRKML